MRTWSVVAVLALMLSGCLSDGDGNGGDDPQGTSFAEGDLGFDADQGPAGTPASGVPTAHGEPTVDEGAATSSPPTTTDPWWHVRQTITIDNDFGGAARSKVRLDVPVGSVTAAPSPDGDYHYTLVLEAYGGTQTEAQQAFDAISWEHDDSLEDGVLRLSTAASSTLQNTGGACTGIPPLATCTGAGWRAHLEALLPTAPAHDLSLSTGSADADASGLGGPTLVFDTGSGDVAGSGLEFGTLTTDVGSGDVDLSGVAAGSFVHRGSSGDLNVRDFTAEAVDIRTGSGDMGLHDIRIGHLTYDGSSGTVDVGPGLVQDLDVKTDSSDMDLRASFHTARLEASSGTIEATLEPTASGTLEVTTGSGDVDLDLARGGSHGHDVDARTSSGDLDIDVQDGSTLSDDEDHVHKRTSGFDGRSVRTVTTVQTSSGDVTVRA